jgi:predicted RNase H-like nuclease (RuvC/YqgF family)
MEAWLERLTVNYERQGTKISRLEVDVSELKTDVSELKTDVSELKTDMRDVKHTAGELKGKSHERDYRDKATSIFGYYLKRGRNVTNEVADQLHAAEKAGQISEQEFDQVLATGLLWGGNCGKRKVK